MKDLSEDLITISPPSLDAQAPSSVGAKASSKWSLKQSGERLSREAPS